MSSNELKEKCIKYNIIGETKKYLSNIEESYNSIAESEKGKLTMCEWIEDNTNIDELKNLTEEQKFFFGLGFLTNELIR